MNSTQGVLEAVNALFTAIEAETAQSNLYFYSMPFDEFAKDMLDAGNVARHRLRHAALKDALQAAGADIMPAGDVYILQFNICISDYIKRPGMVESMLQRKKIFKQLTPSAVRKYAGMDTADFAQLLYDVATDKGQKLTLEDDEKAGFKSPVLMERCLYAAYIYTQITDYLKEQGSKYALVPLNNAMRALGWINTGKLKDYDELEKHGKIAVEGVTFEVKNKTLSTKAIMLNDYFLKECRRLHSAAIVTSVRDYAAIRGRETTAANIKKIEREVVSAMQELAGIVSSCYETVNGKKVYKGQVRISGGSSYVADGMIHWNYNQELYNQLEAIAGPADFPVELWQADPRTSTYYFGRYIAQNRRLNEGKPGREKINLRTLVAKSPNLPTEESVRNSNRDFTGRIVVKTFEQLDALESLNYEVFTEAGEKVENPYSMDYETFKSAYIVVDYTDYPQHPERVNKRKDRQKKAQEAKEKAQLEAAAKAAAAKS